MANAERSPQVVFFDVGETLIRPRQSYGDLLRAVALDIGVDLSKEAFDGLARHIDARVTERTQRGMPFTFPTEASQRFWFETYQVYFREFLRPRDAERLAAAFLGLLSSPEGYEPYEDAIVTLERLLGCGYRLGIISNWEAWLPAMLDSMEIADLFDVVVTSGACGVEKPDERIFLRALADSGHRPAEAVYVGDRPSHDVWPALKAGIAPILLDRTARYPRDARYRTVASLHELVAALGDTDDWVAPASRGCEIGPNCGLGRLRRERLPPTPRDSPPVSSPRKTQHVGARRPSCLAPQRPAVKRARQYDARVNRFRIEMVVRYGQRQSLSSVRGGSMHARVTMASVQPERFDEAVTSVQETFQPAAREQGGFRAFLLLADPSAHQLIGITLWETEADMVASAGGSGYYADAIAAFNRMLVAPATTTTHEVAAFETASAE